MLRRKYLFTLVLIILSSFFSVTLAQSGGKIMGKIVDKSNGDPLPYANIILMETALGAASDMHGKYEIKGIPPGTYILKASFVGYQEELITIDIKSGSKIEVNISLKPETFEGQEVVVTAQAMGQKTAINQQLNAKGIMNAVSSARIQELPDANAAESVGRLPGISIQRSGGEGNKLVVRGLEPKYNAIMVNGVRLSSTDPNDRSVDLSMISPYMLDGIEVSKNVTPDMDADVLGGSVNFKIKTAGGKEQKEGLGYNFLAQGGYNSLSSSQNKYNNYKYVGSVEGRFFDSQLGFFAQADYERRNLTSDQMGLNAGNIGNSRTDYRVSSLVLQSVPRDRKRLNSTLVVDYKLPEGVITLTNMYSSGKTAQTVRQETFGIDGNQRLYNMQYSQIEMNILTNSLNYEQKIGNWDINANLSHTYSETKDPLNWSFTLQEDGAFKNQAQFKDVANINPRDIPLNMNNNLSITRLEFVRTGSNNYSDRAYTGSIDLKTRIDLSSNITAEIKFGGKYRNQNRNYDSDIYNGAGISLESASGIRRFITDRFKSLLISSYIDKNYNYGDFLKGEYPMGVALDEGAFSRLANDLRNNLDFIARSGSAITYSKNNYLSKTNDYTGKENLGAGYIMANIDIGQNINIITGFRYQSLKTEYTASRGSQTTETQLPYPHYDTTTVVTHNHFLPAIIARWKVFSWFDIRAAWTNTLSYPDFQAIIPRIDENSLGGSLGWNNSQLKPTESNNIDIYLSFYDNHLGLFTVGGFYKKITNQIYGYTFFPAKADIWKYFPSKFYDSQNPPSKAYVVNTFINNDNKVDLYGIELDWQTHFWYLPFPFDGMVLNINYTHTTSEAKYPLEVKYSNFPPRYRTEAFEDRLISQPNDIFNLSLGYDYKDFSVRVSMLHQADIFAGVNFWPQLRTTTAAYTRWDISVKQKLPWYGMQVFGLLSNLNNEKDATVLQMYKDIPQSQESYGMTATLGVRFGM